MNTVYYNENDKRAAAWLRELIKKGEIPHGYVDERDIQDVLPQDLQEYRQCHFFAGIGGWPLAIQLAGWPEDRPVWTGSCPCQPFSAAGKGNGFDDERHLWPAWQWLIQQRRPPIIFGEQVGGKAGESWFDLVSNDLEAEDYACGAVTFPACSVGAPHLRQRLYWVGISHREHPRRNTGASPETERGPLLRPERDLPGSSGAVDRAAAWADPDWIYCRDGKYRPVIPAHVSLFDGISHPMGLGIPGVNCEAEIEEVSKGFVPEMRKDSVSPACASSGRGPFKQYPVKLDDVVRLLPSSLSLAKLDGRRRDVDALSFLHESIGKVSLMPHSPKQTPEVWASLSEEEKNRIAMAVDVRAWRKLVFSPLSSGEVGRLGRLRGYGNSIVPQQASEFIRAAKK